ncbi:PAS domain S-box protein [Bradyrhizobium diazoefficiens]|uniref:LuxR C-terminal-related transcriptional regulator n=1 Tax=Bradyrhizobium diazoefficiens TaxID=1355477 RepID=UPI00190A9E00|nr:LuxR C-terminal-related transcriptional regulator [Bradyrhizobium diazoefficiens]QQO16748.1 PAS domain S-box protein [Bradyrhizobium diazoefficiens]
MEVDYKRAFENSPVGQAIARNRVIVACNHTFAAIFRSSIADLVGQTFERLYPTQADYESTGRRVGARLSAERSYSDDRVMRRINGDLFWVRVSGFTYTPRNAHAHTLWVFTELAKTGAEGQSLRSSLTDRERDVATLLIEGKTGKEVAKALGISPRTVDIYRTRLLRKYNAANTAELITLLLTA